MVGLPYISDVAYGFWIVLKIGEHLIPKIYILTNAQSYGKNPTLQIK